MNIYSNLYIGTDLSSEFAMDIKGEREKKLLISNCKFLSQEIPKTTKYTNTQVNIQTSSDYTFPVSEYHKNKYELTFQLISTNF